jgi:hypothetical protein
MRRSGRNTGRQNQIVKKWRRRLRGVERLEERHLLAVVINEFHYDPDNPVEQSEFLELHNTGAAAVDLSGWRLDEAVDFAFPAGSSISAGGYVVVSQNAAHFQARFGFAPLGVWQEGDKLSNEGETIELRNAADALVDTVTYQLGWPWPTSGEFGSSVELINPALDNDLSGSWRSSGLSGGVEAGAVLVPTGSAWRYRKGITQNPPTHLFDPARDWRETGFVVSNDVVPWQLGNASIGYGDNDDATVLADMAGTYSSFYARRSFTINGTVPDIMELRMYVDDGAIVYINGVELPRFHVTGGDKDFDDTAGMLHEAAWEDFTITGASAYLVPGENTIAVHVLNQPIDSSDVSFDLELRLPGGELGPPTPGAQNSVFAENSAPQMRQLEQSIQQPAPGQDVVITMKVTDPNGVQSVTLDYQLVDPGNYIEIEDPRYLTQWTTVPMFDNGTSGDATAGDGVYSVTMAGSLNTNRRLVRYRVTAVDTLGASVTGPYADDPQPNFAYYVFGETPTWNGAARPGVTPVVPYGPEVLDSIATYTLITRRGDHEDAQHIPNTNQGGYGGDDYLWQGTLVYDGVVYDHIRYRARGGVWRYAMGKNMWKFDFNRGHGFEARDDYGNKYEVPWDKLNFSAVIQQGDFWHRGEQGLFESVGFKLFNLAGVPASNTNFVHFRIVESASETGANQYSTDFQGLYLAVEDLEREFLDEHGLPDGNLYKMENGLGVGGIGGELTHQGDFPAVTDSSDLIQFKNTYQSGPQTAAWWRDNLNLDKYYSYRSIVEAIHHYDIGNGKNYYYFNNPQTGVWEVVPWDIDLTWANNMFGDGNEPFRNRVLAIPEFTLEYRNRIRELRDLLINVEQVGLVVDEMAQFIYTPGQPSFVDADRAMWDYNPILVSNLVNPSKAGHGRFYAGGQGIPAAGSFAGMMQVLKNYALTRSNYIDSTILTLAEEGQAPRKPSITYSGAAGFPIDGLQFNTGAFQDAQGNPFAKMEWRLAEISNPNTAGFDPTQPWKYEVDATWESGELTTYANSTTVPVSAVEAGKTYRARVRMQDSTGRWSHWSEPLQFVTAAAEQDSPVRIVELHYNPAPEAGIDDQQELEFIELLNTGQQPVDLSTVRLTMFSNTPYTFPAGLMLAPGQRIVVAKNPTTFKSVYGDGINLAPEGYGTQNLSNGGETIILETVAGVAIQTITWEDGDPWPTEPDGNGPSLEIIDPLGDGSAPANWKASDVDGGTPGTGPNTGPAQPGDYDNDGDVDGNDFLAWQRTLAATGAAFRGADGSGNGVVDAADLTVWRDGFGSTAGAAASVVARIEEAAAGPLDFAGWIFTDDRVATGANAGPSQRSRISYRPPAMLPDYRCQDAALTALLEPAPAIAVADDDNVNDTDDELAAELGVALAEMFPE